MMIVLANARIMIAMCLRGGSGYGFGDDCNLMMMVCYAESW